MHLQGLFTFFGGKFKFLLKVKGLSLEALNFVGFYDLFLGHSLGHYKNIFGQKKLKYSMISKWPLGSNGSLACIVNYHI